MPIDTSNFNFQGIDTVSAVGIPGCTDPTASNYAGDVPTYIDDGSCDYSGGLFTHIPDANFRAALDAAHSVTWQNNDIASEYVLTSEIAILTSLDVPNHNISDLTGIEDFAMLDDLNCWGNQLTNLDVSNNGALTILNCMSNQLTSLDVSGATTLVDLNCGVNQLTTLDLIDTSGAVDVAYNPALEILWCFDNQLTSLDVSLNTALISFYCQTNNLTSLGVSTNVAIEVLHCMLNQITSLDLRNNIALTSLVCHDNQLTSLDVRNGNNGNILNSNYFQTTNNPNLTCIDVDDPVYSAANWSAVIDPQHCFGNDCSTSGCTV